MPIKPKDRTWYIVATCEQCSSTIFLFRDLNDGNGSLQAKYLVTCPYCQHKGQYDGQHYQHLHSASEA